MRTYKRVLVRVTAVAVALFSSSACSSTSDSSTKTTTTTARTTTAPTATAPTLTTAVTDTVAAGAGSVEATKEVLTALLLTPADIGPSFSEATYSGPAPSTPCGVAVDEKVPYAALAGTVAKSGKLELAFLEEIRGYDTTEAAQLAYKTGVDGLSCGTGNGVAIGRAQDVSAQLGVTAVALQVSTADLEGVLVVAQVDNTVISFQFEGIPGAAAAANAADPLVLAATGVARIVQSANN